MKRTPVKSSNIKSIGYDSSKRLLEIEFNSGAVYQYHPIMEQIYNEMKSAPSVGTYFHTKIRNNDLVTTKQIK